MKITFKLVNEKFVEIYGDGKIIGHIFTPSGSGGYVQNAIQVCGFEEAYDLWGCGVFGESKPNYVETVLKIDGEIETLKSEKRWRMKKDIQLLFTPYEQIPDFYRNHGLLNECARCYSKPCICENKLVGNPFFIKFSFDAEIDRLLEKSGIGWTHTQDQIARFDEGLEMSEEEANKIFGVSSQKEGRTRD